MPLFHKLGKNYAINENVVTIDYKQDGAGYYDL